MPRLDILKNDKVARKRKEKVLNAELGRVVPICVMAGPLLGVLAILIVSSQGNGEVSPEFMAYVILLPPFIGIMIWFPIFKSWIVETRWELSEKGIRVKGPTRMSIRWSEIEEIRFRPLDDLPGYTSVVIQKRPRFKIFTPIFTGITVKASEDELRRLLVENPE